METLSKLTFGAATAYTGYLVRQCMTPPNEPRKIATEAGLRDTLATKPFFIISALYRTGFLALTAWQGAVCVNRAFAPAPNPLYPINNTYLAWNKFSAATFLLIWTSGWIRLTAFEQLGKKFTFELHEPDKLKKDGLYRYVQHPSYSGGVPAIVGAAYWFLRCDGVLATILPPTILQHQTLINFLVPLTILVAALVGIPLRVFDEETMLRKKFGKEWELWHSQTARFIPFLI